MSKSQISLFFEQVESNKELQTVLKELSTENEQQVLNVERAALDKVVQLASKWGYSFTSDELARLREPAFPKLPPSFEEEKKRLAEEAKESGFKEMTFARSCCHYAQGCMPFFSGRG